MTDPELKQMLTMARSEIIDLRHKNEVLQAKDDVMNLFTTLLNTTLAARPMKGTDVAWEIELALRQLENK